MRTIFLIFFSMIFFGGCSDRPKTPPVSASKSVSVDSGSQSSRSDNIPADNIFAEKENAKDPLLKPKVINTETIDKQEDISSDLPVSGQSGSEEKSDSSKEIRTSDPIADFLAARESLQWDPDDPNDPIRRFVLEKAKKNREQRKYHPAIDEESVKNSGIRFLAGKRIQFFTDLPSAPELDQFPIVLDLALEKIAGSFGIPQENLDLFHIDAFLIGNKEPFQKQGILDNVPDFENGYSSINRIFAMDQRFDYYNRFLLIHELVHSFMFEIFGQLEPYWFSEGCAEYTALYRWNGKEMELGILPSDPSETPGFERLRTIQKDVQKGAIKSLEEIFAFGPRDYVGTRGYAWSWAFVLFMSNHPSYKNEFRKMPYLMMFDHPNERFKALYKDRMNELRFDWNDFVRSFDYRYNFDQMVVDHTPGTVLEGQKDLDFSLDRGWQNSGIRMEAGKQYRIRAVGNYQISDPRGDLPCTPGGITFRYYQGYPIGQLLGILFTETTESDRIFPIGNGTRITPERSGTLYLRINDSGGKIGRNKGNFKVRIEEI